jgi:hypothetical protein
LTAFSKAGSVATSQPLAMTHQLNRVQGARYPGFDHFVEGVATDDNGEEPCYGS